MAWQQRILIELRSHIIIEVSDGASLAILSDISGLLALREFNPSDPLMYDILTSRAILDQAGKYVQFFLVSCDVGIGGNKTVYVAARCAATVPCTRCLRLPACCFIPL